MITSIWRTKKDLEIERLQARVAELKDTIAALEAPPVDKPLRLFTLTFDNNEVVKVVGHTTTGIDTSNTSEGYSVYLTIHSEQRTVAYFRALPVKWHCVWLPEDTALKVGIQTQ